MAKREGNCAMSINVANERIESQIYLIVCIDETSGEDHQKNELRLKRP
jgi:hypothetical protein